MVYTEHAPKRQQFHVAPAMQQPKSAISTPLPRILIILAMKGYNHSIRITCEMYAVSLLSSREYRCIKAMNNNNNKKNTKFYRFLKTFYVFGSCFRAVILVPDSPPPPPSPHPSLHCCCCTSRVSFASAYNFEKSDRKFFPPDKQMLDFLMDNYRIQHVLFFNFYS